ncbi:hypothetical protein JTE90_004955 [Oedothorax gibbosus]|uniref:CRAL-TRIO domain-containing protein n=1 Tax=Oedothorax gibbosus TaxID=931172 RepID=A0AAV6V9L9_9ARAC|nr:hypothetical protein JTE90_004955 [Oedothorax gibbosus]
MYDRIDIRTAKKGVEILPLEMGYLPEFFQKKAELELDETPEKIIEYTNQIREMIKQDNKLMDYDFDDDWIVQYLRCRKFNVEKTFQRLKIAKSWINKYPEAYTNYSFDETIRTISDRICTVLPWRCHEGCAIVLIELDNWRPNLFPVDAMKRMFVLLVLQALKAEPMTQVNGFKVIIDVKCSSIRYLRHCTPQNMYMLYSGIFEVSPGRFKAIHVVNDSLTFKTAWLIIKQFMSSKVKERVHFHSSKKTLLDLFPKDVLPVSFGGDLENYDQTAWLKNRMTPEALASLGGGCMEKMAMEA